MRIPAAASLAACLAMPLHAQDDVGARTYFEACGPCHGETAEGDGPMTEIMNVAVPDLTGLTAANGGTFPWFRLVHIIDGRSGLRAHGGEMPVFGAILRGDTVAADAPDGSPILISARVLAVVDYLESIQD